MYVPLWRIQKSVELTNEGNATVSKIPFPGCLLRTMTIPHGICPLLPF